LQVERLKGWKVEELNGGLVKKAPLLIQGGEL
jgi:hypothetical protein